MTLRRILVAFGVLAGLALVGVSDSEAQALRIGVFDAQKIFESTAEGAKIQAQLGQLNEAKRAEIEGKQKELADLRQELISTGTSLSPEKLREKRMIIDRKTIELESANKSASHEFQTALQDAQNAWQGRVLELVQKYGKDNGYTLILPISVVAYYSDATDITDELVKLIDQPSAPAGS